LPILYIIPIFYIFKKRTQNLLFPIFISTLSFVNGLFISQRKSYKKLNINLFCSYIIIFSFFKQFGLTIKYNKLEMFCFSRFIKNYNPPSLDLDPLEGPFLQPKDKWKYLDFIFNKNSPSINTFTFIPTRLCLLLKIWKCWVILLKCCRLYISNFLIGYIPCLLLSIVSNCDTSKRCLSFIFSKD